MLRNCVGGRLVLGLTTSHSGPVMLSRRFDWGRTLRLCAFNGAMGVFGHYYYASLDRVVMFGTATSPKSIFAKVGIDQFIFAPVCTMLFYAFKVTTELRPR